MGKKIAKKEFEPIENTKYSRRTKKVKEIEIKDNEVKKSSKKNNDNKHKKIIIHDKLELILSLVFIILLIITIMLGFKVHEANKTQKERVKAEIVVPVLGKNVNNSLSVDVSNMKKGETKSYTFKITNTKDKSTNPEEILYAIGIESDNVEVEVYKNGSEENILNKDAKYIIDNKLSANEEQTDSFTLKIKAKKATGKRELVTIKVIS